MLHHLHMHNVGPAPGIEFDFAERLNLITGDNGLGKSFVLDVAWWALTRSWAGEMARPAKGLVEASISLAFEAKTGRKDYASDWVPKDQDWSPRQLGRPANPGMVIYAQVDGGFALWDPARNYYRSRKGLEQPDRPSHYSFAPGQVWDGLEDNGVSLCEGLIRDWASWQKEKGEAFEQLQAVLEGLSPSPSEQLRPGGFARLGIEARDIPTLRMPYGQDVPVVHASAGMRRIIALAYLLVWTWQEHLKASELLGQPPAEEITFLVDEIEAHLHPRWQRRILRALLGVMDKLTGTSPARVQVLATTHSPLLLTSLEPLFDPDRDALWTFDLVDRAVELSKVAWHRQGDANRWLTSQVFDLAIPRSIEAELALQRADALLRDHEPDPDDLRRADAELRNVLPDDDAFWSRWGYFLEQQGAS